MSAQAAQYLALSRRSILSVVRKPISIVPPLTFPLLFLALSSAAYEETIRLPGFPEVDSFLQFLVTTTIIQGALFGAIWPGSDLAADIEGGFFDRLVVSPVARTSIIVGRLAGAATVGFAQAWLFFGLAHLFGLRVEGGFGAIVVITLVAALFAAGVGALFVALGLWTGSSEAVLGSFPAVFAFYFLSSAFFPRALMSGWFETAATINPLSHMIEGLRTQVITGLDPGAFSRSASIAAGVLIIGVVLSGWALRHRLAGPR